MGSDISLDTFLPSPVARDKMESLYLCLPCTRILTTGTRTASGKRLGRILTSSRRSFASARKQPHTIKSQHAPLRPRQMAVKAPVRLASTAAARIEEEDNFERHNIPPNEFGEYMSQARTVLREDNLFHPFSKSPVPQIRQRAAFTKQHAYCPHPAHQQTRVPTSPHDPEARKILGQNAQPPAHVSFECPDCGIATYCCEEHWADDFEAHLEICDTLRQINEDDHDLRSGRWFPEFEYPGPQLDEILVNMTSWDTFLYTRGFEAINADRSMRQATRLLTYPLTIGSVLHELSPYNIRPGGRLTVEGLKSLSGKSRRGA
jgi:Zinc-finger of mitochondrial splicing suppressor 51